MRLIILDKTISVKDNIDDLSTVNLEENIEYLKNNEGIAIKGNIEIEGEYLCKSQIKYFTDSLDIDLFAPYEEVIDKENIALKIKDFDYINGGNKIIFTFKFNIEGWKEVSKTFLAPDVSKEIEQEAILIESNENPEVVTKIKELLEKCKELDIKDECIATYLEKGVKEVENIINVESEDRSNLIKFNINGEEKDEEKDEEKVILDSGDENEAECQEIHPIKIIEEEKELKINKNSINNIFSRKNKVITMFSYRVVYEGETYETIANEEKVTIFDLKKFNKNKILREGSLIKIPLKK